MADFTTIDPWSQVLLRLWALLEANTDFCAAVKAANRIKFTAASGANPLKTQIQDGDTPEVMITMDQSSDRPALTSVQSGSDQQFQIQVTTLDMRLRKTDGTGANDLRWLIWQILNNAGDSLGLDFVYKTRIQSALVHYIDPINRGTLGWVCFFTVTCNLQLPKDYAI